MRPLLNLAFLLHLVSCELATYDLNDENFESTMLDLLNKPKETLPLFINMLMGECTLGECPGWSRDLHKVARIAQRQNRIATVDCGNDGHVCASVPKPEVRNNAAAIYIRDGKIYGFDGAQNQAGLLEYFSSDNWKNSEVLEGDFQDYAERALGFKMSFNDRVQQKLGVWSQNMETWSKAKFKKVPYVDRWSVTAKVLIVSAFFIPPIVFVIFFGLLWLQV